jgi:DNA repair protein SbcC/Rad50
MDGPHLQRLVIENFRSIDKKIEVHLDAPVVLVHGPNGVGKTSLLSAIELAFTGAVPSMLRADARYTEQLLHYGASEGKVVLDLGNVQGVTAPLEVTFTPKGMTRSGNLEAKHTKFFSERCYLAQSVLTQLLTIYQEANGGVESLLSRFVSELLGLDRLDALELGLEQARDRRNARKLAPSYVDVEQESDRLNAILRELRSQLDRATDDLDRSTTTLQASLSSLDLDIPSTAEGLLALQSELLEESEERSLNNLADRSRQLLALRREYERRRQISQVEQSAVSPAHQSAQQELLEWRRQFLNDITTALEGVSPYFPNADWVADVAPGRSVANALVVTNAEINRLEEAETRLIAGNKRLIELDDARRRNEIRTSELDKEIGSITTQADALSVILSELFGHLHGEECPVCGRDYSEVSEEPLAAHVAKKSSELSDEAERLRVLTAERNVLASQSVAHGRERSEIESRSLVDGPLSAVQDRLAKLRAAATELRAVQPAALAGDRLISAELSSRPRPLSQRGAAPDENDLRLELAGHAATLGMSLEPREEVESILDRLDASIEEVERITKARLTARRAAIENLREFNLYAGRVVRLREQIQEEDEKLKPVAAALNSAERIRRDIRRILVAATATRAMVVGRVFNEQLNSLWRDLFVRLAPAEAFVPFFEVPVNPSWILVPNIKTRHRSGATGGTPAAMLSSSNLNTAALTLFLALHLSVPKQLPWLILDDPVQSMDEVHISQFAALLRTLSKEEGRQVVIAVHDRPLFDYLSLELSPAFEGDELITIALSKSADGHSRYLPTRRSFEPDTSVKPLAA